MASQLGLENVSIGALAKATSMSKSGLFAHFESKENLQIEILNHAGMLFTQQVITPAIRTKAGIPRIMALLDNYISWDCNLTGGCIFVTASTDYKDRPGKVRDFLLKQQLLWIESLAQIAESAVGTGEFRKDADCEQFAFEFYSLLLGVHLYYKLLNKSDIKKRYQTAFEKLLHSFR
ncbi:MAG: TetR/AcrR family transcriptional regulator [Desulfobacteraceae bacterium]|nr:TetR/AcrR family transcriptional regulator [Desulfobacteraceae bacterium]